MIGFLKRLFRRKKSLEDLEKEDFWLDYNERAISEGSDSLVDLHGRDTTGVADSEDEDYDF